MRQCYSCAARDGEAEFPARKPNGARRLCCAGLSGDKAGHDRIGRPDVLTRAQWRARERARQASPQMDLVDYISVAARP